jgi:hypothetical protein
MVQQNPKVLTPQSLTTFKERMKATYNLGDEEIESHPLYVMWLQQLQAATPAAPPGRQTARGTR